MPKASTTWLLCATTVLYGTASLFGAEPTSQPASRPFTLRVPGKTWALLIESKGLQTRQYDLDRTGQQVRFLAEDPNTQLTLSVFLEPAASPGDHKACRRFYWAKAKQTPLPKDNIELSDTNDMAMVRYLVPRYKGVEVQQQHAHAYLAHDGVWIDVHVSKGPYHEAQDRKLFDRVFAAMRIATACPVDAKELFLFGETFYRRNDYNKAAAFFQQAIDLEAKHRTLDTTIWRVLVDQLGMAYGISGQLGKAKATFKEAIDADPEYPMFYYNLACTHAEANELDPAIPLLISAFERQANLNPSERMPDPTTDSSFSRFRSDRRFQEAIKKISELNSGTAP